MVTMIVLLPLAGACGGSGGECGDGCEPGSLQCLGNSVQVCADYDDDGCFEWGGDQACRAGQTCIDGECRGDCTDLCELNARRCEGDAVQYCWDFDANGCLEWGGTSPCGSDEVCTDGQCLFDCPDACREGAYRCDGNDVQVCGDYDGDDCPEWGTGTPCAPDETCLLGACIVDGTTVLFVSPQGDDAWSGTLPEPDGTGTDGPLLTMAGARDEIRELKGAGTIDGPVRVFMREGVYPIEEPVEFQPEDSGTEDAPISYERLPGERPVLSGGRVITGLAADAGLWVETLLEVIADGWTFSSIWANGERRTRAAAPNEGFYHTAGRIDPPNRGFLFHAGDLAEWDDLEDAVVEVYHSWATSLHRIETLDAENRIVTFTQPASWDFEYWGGEQRYRVINVFEELDAPGEWHLSGSTGAFAYVPMEGETPWEVEVVAPVADRLIVLSGDPAAGTFVAHLAFRGLELMHTEWQPAPDDTASGQAAVSMGGAVEVTGGRYISIDRCRIGHVGTYGVWFGQGTQQSEVVETEMFDLGGGGVRIGETSTPPSEEQAAGYNRVDNCWIHDGGKILPAAVGVWIGRSSYNEVTHNEISDLFYTGVSVGWSWGYDPSTAHHNIVADNHIHHIGRRVLSDMGGVYTLGQSPGTEVRHNLIHDVFSYSYGGWGLYTDEGSSEILLQDNLVVNTKSGGFHQHYGRDNQVTNNILAFSHEGQVRRSREEAHNSFTFTSNIVLFNNGWLLDGTWSNGNFTMISNLYWDLERPSCLFECMTFEAWQGAGHDADSVVEDPRFADPYGLDFSLPPSSPATRVGFEPFELDSFGLYGDPAWVALPLGAVHTEFGLPEESPPPFSDGFEDTQVGARADAATTWGEAGTASIRVTGETSATGSQCLKFQDAPGLDYSWNPHMAYDPRIQDGTVRVVFSVWLGSGAVLYHEWRDDRSPYNAGPSIFIQADGTLTASGVSVTSVPLNEWITLDITFDVGPQGGGLYDLAVTTESTGTETFTDLGTEDLAICGLRWLGFVSNANAATEMFLDDVSFERI